MLIVIRMRETDRHVEAVAAMREAAEPFGETLRPMLPAATDSPVARYFTLSVPDAGAADRVVARLRSCPDVDAAFVKPEDALP